MLGKSVVGFNAEMPIILCYCRVGLWIERSEIRLRNCQGPARPGKNGMMNLRLCFCLVVIGGSLGCSESHITLVCVQFNPFGWGPRLIKVWSSDFVNVVTGLPLA